MIKKHFVEVGKQYHDWLVLRPGRSCYYVCRCSCGVEKEVLGKHLVLGNSKSCFPCSGKKYSQKKYENNIKLKGSNKRHAWVLRKIQNLFQEQGGLCPICSLPLPEDPTKWAWDHDHVTEKGRGLTHRGCNVFIGFLERHPGIIERSLKYLEDYEKVNSPAA
jgi:hypothetical protein